jgi:ATP/maltotriose-dependent transcriptional regulator MalT/DNA-binding SARP family transcriptional activator
MTQVLSTTAFAKSTRPELAGAVQRKELYARLDGTPARTVAWISAPPGYGKTTLAASYLESRSYRWAWYEVDRDDDDGTTFLHYLAHATRRFRAKGDGLPAFGPEHRGDLTAFARRFFRALFSETIGPVALVLDNLHELAAESPLRVILEAGLSQVPRLSCVIVTSRSGPPATLSRLQLGGQMVCLGVDDLRFTPAELTELSQIRGRPMGPEALLQLQQRADGWAAALVLMLEHRKPAYLDSAADPDATPRAVFDYLAGEIFEGFDRSTQRLLLQLACLPRLTIDVARAVSGDPDAARVLFNLAHNDYFVRELVGPDGRVFVIHRLLREFLLHRAARDLPHAVGPGAMRRAALLLRESGQAEDALALLVECQDWLDVAGLVVAQADKLLSQGRHATLATWLSRLPPLVREADPDLMLAQGRALSHSSPRVARRSFETAFEAYERRGDTRAALNACVGVIHAVLQEFDDLAQLDRWLEVFERCGAGAHIDSVPAPVMWARLWRDPAHPSLSQSARTGDAEVVLRSELARSTAALLAGDVARATAIAKGATATHAAQRLALAIADALRRFADGDAAGALASARAGLDMGESEAIHTADGWLYMLCSASACMQGDHATALSALAAAEAAAPRRGELAFLHGLRAWAARTANEPGAALREARSASMLAAEAGLPWLEALSQVTTAQLLAATGERQGADAQLRGAEATAQRLRSALLQVSTQFAQAAVAIECADEAAALAPLRSGLALARDLGLRHVPGLPPASMGRLCATALRMGLAVDQTRLLISAGRLEPPATALRLRQWPWAFEVTTFGGFTLRRGSAPIEFSTKGPGRPVELLKVLVAMGGQNVRADQLGDALWPHVDADYAHKSFTATLHRLRRIFDGEDTLRLSDGRLSLNDTLFRVDTWAMDHLLGEIERCLRVGAARGRDSVLHGLVDELLSIYRGPFLPDEDEQPGYIAAREQWRARLLRTITRCARHWEEQGSGDAAVDCYQRCIDADDLCESLYRNLMLCHQRQGEVADALATYDRLRAVMAARLKCLPSPETQAVRSALRP